MRDPRPVLGNGAGVHAQVCCGNHLRVVGGEEDACLGVVARAGQRQRFEPEPPVVLGDQIRVNVSRVSLIGVLPASRSRPDPTKEPAPAARRTPRSGKSLCRRAPGGSAPFPRDGQHDAEGQGFAHHPKRPPTTKSGRDQTSSLLGNQEAVRFDTPAQLEAPRRPRGRFQVAFQVIADLDRSPPAPRGVGMCSRPPQPLSRVHRCQRDVQPLWPELEDEDTATELIEGDIDRLRGFVGSRGAPE